MKLRVRGKAYNVKKPIVGRITFDDKCTSSDSILIGSVFSINRHLAVLQSSETPSVKNTKQKIVYNLPYVDHLQTDDIVSITSDGLVKTMIRAEANHSYLLVTERCNSNCLMCSQPPKDKDDIDYLFNVNTKVISLLPKDMKEIGITGGEPTLLGEKFYLMMKQIKTHLPDTAVHVLTNGRTFAWESTVLKLSEVRNSKAMYGIPLYSDIPKKHDYIVQAKDAFNQTIKGIYNLGKHNHRIEIRIVLHKLTTERLIKLSEYIYRNIPFVEQVCFMGLEFTGYTPFNSTKLWVDPYEYMDTLRESVLFLDRHNIKVKIYNLQLCLLPKELWSFSVKSISDWKNIYFKECQNCKALDQCGGLFESHMKKHSNHIKAIKK